MTKEHRSGSRDECFLSAGVQWRRGVSFVLMHGPERLVDCAKVRDNAMDCTVYGGDWF